MQEVSLAIETKEALLEKLKKKVSLRNQMGGALYWNVCNDECCQIANECLTAGGDRTEIEAILGPGTFC